MTKSDKKKKVEEFIDSLEAVLIKEKQRLKIESKYLINLSDKLGFKKKIDKFFV